MSIIYLDYNATTPIDTEVANIMRPFLDSIFGNPSSIHAFGIEAKKATIQARNQIADLLNSKSSEIVFTSGGSESNNMAIKGVAFANKNKGNHIITSSVEHPAVIEVCKYLENNGFQVTYLPVNEFGTVSSDDLEKAITQQTILISIMHANNEVGTIQPIAEIGKIAKKHNILFHTDAAQSLGKIPVDVQELGVDLLSIAGHKLYAPKGIGALYIKSGVVLEKLIHGANHERNLRAGTENILEIAGLGKACEIAKRDINKTHKHLSELRNKLEDNLLKSGLDCKLNGDIKNRLPNTLSISFKNIEANTLLFELSDVAASAGAACHSEGIDVSSVLSAMKIPIEYAMGTIRFSTGKMTTNDEIEKASEKVISATKKLLPNAEFIEPEISTEKIKLTHFTHGMGCACKLRPQDLEKVLSKIPILQNANVIIGSENADDAAVYKINNEQALVATLDFFTPIVDDPYEFGAIAAANALSDIYAMGAIPLFALNIVGFPDKRLPLSVLQSILLGAKDKASEASIPILGGHTVEDTEPKFGMVVIGLVHPEKIMSNDKAKPNQSIIFTKPLGTGILSTACKRGLTDEATNTETAKQMMMLNKTASEIMQKHQASTATDVTGFGFIGHLREVLKASKLDAEILLSKVPVLPQVREFIAEDIVPGGSIDNLNFNKKYCNWESGISDIDKILLNDAQTSGGLLIFCPIENAKSLVNDLRENGINSAEIVGTTTKGDGKVNIIS